MNHLVIRQNNGITEEVSNAIISKLYELAEAGLDAQSSVVGRVHVEKTYRHMVEALTGQTGYFPELYITKDNYIAYFEDPEVKRIMQNTYGELLENQLSSITSIGDTFAETSIKTFMELGQTSVTELAWDAFKDCADLEHVDVSNITDLGSVGGTNRTHTFMGCSKLEELDFSSLQFGYLRFSDNGSIVANCPLLKSVNMPEYLGSDRWKYENNYSSKDYAFQV